MPILRAKISPPSLPRHVVERPRLVERVLSEPWRLVVLEAPAGYGKSVLAAQLQARSPRDTAWLHVDPDDADPRRFCRHVAAALATVVPEIERTELMADGNRNFDTVRWTDDLLLFCEEVTRRTPRLILDNYEVVAGDEDARLWLERILDSGSRRLQLVITTRQAPGLKLHKLLASHEALILGPEELSFDLEEYRRAAAARGFDPEVEDLEAAWAESRGWCALLGFSGMRARPAASRPDLAYVEEEVLGALPQALREFLVRTSVLEVISADGLRALGLHDGAPEDWSDRIAASGIPHWRLGPEPGVCIHPLMRELLFAELKRDAVSGPTLIARAARHVAAVGRYDSAIRLLGAADMHEEILTLLDDCWFDLDSRNLLPRVGGWLESLPDACRFHPLYASSWTNYLRVAGLMRPLWEYMVELRKRAPDLESWSVYPRLWNGEAFARILLGKSLGYDANVATWERVRPSDDARALLSGEISLTTDALYELRYEAAIRHAENAVSLVPDGLFQHWTNTRQTLAMVLLEVGQARRCIEICRRNVEECKEHGEEFYLQSNLVGLAYGFKDLGEFESSLDVLAEADALGHERPLLVPHKLRCRGEALWHLGRRDEGLQALDRAYETFLESNRLEALATGVLIDHWKELSGIPSELVSEADFEELPRCEPRVRLFLRRGRQAAAQGDLATALEQLRLAREMAREMPTWLAAAWLTEAWARAQAEGPGAGRDALARGLQFLDDIDYANFPMADPALIAWVIAEATAAELYPERAEALVHSGIRSELTAAIRDRLESETLSPEESARLIRAATLWRIRGLEPLVEKAGVPEADRTAYLERLRESPLPALDVRLFGEFEAKVEGRLVQFSRKASRQLLEMLLLEYPRGIHEERLMDALWPEANPRSARQSLQTAANQLRVALDPWHRPNQPSYLKFANAHYVLDLPPGCRIDWLAFTRRVPEVLAQLGRQPNRARWNDLLELLDLYRGDLLADAPYAEYAAEARERAKALFLEACVGLAGACAEPDRTAAVRTLERGLEVDPYWSEGLALLMEMLRKEGRVLAAVRRYRAFQARLEADLGVEPDPPLQRRYEELVGTG